VGALVCRGAHALHMYETCVEVRGTSKVSFFKFCPPTLFEKGEGEEERREERQRDKETERQRENPHWPRAPLLD